MGAFGDYTIQDDPLMPPPAGEGAAAGGDGSLEELDLFADILADHDAGRKRKEPAQVCCTTISPYRQSL